jgi:enoyl-CoA hydratase
MNDFKTIQVSESAGIWTLRVFRPEALNALNSLVLTEMGQALQTIKAMDFSKARALIVTGAGEKAFVAGADIKEISEIAEGKGQSAKEFAKKGQAIFRELGQLRIPVIARVNGFALGGGCELALACDFIYASENAKFGLPEVSLGLIPGFGGTVRMSRAIGMRQARELTFSGALISANEAFRFGLVNKVLPTIAELDQAIAETTKTILSRAPMAVAMAKRSILETWDLDIKAGETFEADQFAELFATQDVKEGTLAFLEKRKPSFRGY